MKSSSKPRSSSESSSLLLSSSGSRFWIGGNSPKLLPCGAGSLEPNGSFSPRFASCEACPCPKPANAESKSLAFWVVAAGVPNSVDAPVEGTISRASVLGCASPPGKAPGTASGAGVAASTGVSTPPARLAGGMTFVELPASLPLPTAPLMIGKFIGVNCLLSGGGGGSDVAGSSLAVSVMGGVAEGVDSPADDNESATAIPPAPRAAPPTPAAAAAGIDRPTKLVAGGVPVLLPACPEGAK